MASMACERLPPFWGKLRARPPLEKVQVDTPATAGA